MPADGATTINCRASRFFRRVTGAASEQVVRSSDVFDLLSEKTCTGGNHSAVLCSAQIDGADEDSR